MEKRNNPTDSLATLVSQFRGDISRKVSQLTLLAEDLRSQVERLDSPNEEEEHLSKCDAKQPQRQ